MADNTIIPRPGIEANQMVTLEFARSTPLDQRQQGELESNLNTRFVEPQQMGELEFVFRSRVSQSGFFDDRVVIQTTAGRMPKDALDEIIQIAEDSLGVNIVDWDIEAQIDRKSLAVDET